MPELKFNQARVALGATYVNSHKQVNDEFIIKWHELTTQQRNALVASALGWTEVDVRYVGGGRGIDNTYTLYPAYTTNILAAWEIVAITPDIIIQHRRDGSYYASCFYDNKQFRSSYCTTAPEAICIVYLQTRGYELEEVTP